MEHGARLVAGLSIGALWLLLWLPCASADDPPDAPRGPASWAPAPAPEQPPSLRPDEGSGDLPSHLAVQCPGQGVCTEKLTGLPLRVLPKSFSSVYKTKQAAPPNIARANVAAFSPLYVFAREDLDLSDPANPLGWYQVGQSEKGPPLGWMQAKDVLEWKQALLVSYTHPGSGEKARQRVLMFRDLAELRRLAESPQRERDALAVYERIEQGDIPPAVVSKEPERFVDITRKFYLLPVIEFATVDILGDEARYLQIAAALPGARGPDTLRDPGYRDKALRQPSPLDSGEAKELGIDLVFVMDMTISMQPYIDRTKEAMAEIAQRITQQAIKEKIRFGLVGYRDDVSTTPGLGFTRKNFTPELVSVESLTGLLENEAKAAAVSSRGYSEEVFAGVEMGLDSAWSKNTLRFIVLVGDASSHPEGHEQNTTGKNAAILRQAARDEQIHIVAMHLQDPKHRDDHPLALAQYSALSKIRGEDRSAIVEVDIKEPEAFQSAVETIAGEVARTIAAAQREELSDKAQESAILTTSHQTPNAVQQAENAIQGVIRAALVEYLGKDADPPKDIVAWAFDRDLTDPAVTALDVRVLVTKEQLSDLTEAVDQVVTALARAEFTQMQFFDALQSVAGQTLKRPDAIRQANTLAETDLLPAYLESLPYKSEILWLDKEKYASMPAEGLARLESHLRAKVRQYRDINEQVDGWVRLNEADPDGKKVFPLHLDYLP